MKYSDSRFLTRRSFLVRSAAAAAVLGVPQFVPRSVLGAAGQPGPSETIRIAGIGIGRQGSSDLAEAAKRPGVKVVAVADVWLERAKEQASKYGGEAVQDFRRVLDRKDVDAIITATPEQWRGPICLQACQAGKDLFVEKPMSLTIHEGRLMVQAARKYGRVFQVGSQQRSMVKNRIGCEFIRNGGVGKLTRVIAHNYPSPWEYGLPAEPVPDGLDWDMWCGPAPLVAYNKDLYAPRANPGWLSFRHFSGGEMTGWGAHGFDQVQWALGMDESGPVEIWTEGGKFDPPTYTASEPKARGDKICGSPKVLMRYANGVVMELGEGPDGGAIFEGEKGRVTINRNALESDPDELVEDLLRNRPRGVSENHMANWIDCIRTRARPVADVEIGHRSATVCHLGNIARWVGRKLRWDPVKEIFPDDAEANKHLDRERRKPWGLPEKV
jgi:predicted dehydrogenase